MLERGEKLEQSAMASAKLADKAKEYGDAISRLAKKQEKKWF